MSSLYFRGKLAYARAFANPPRNLPGVHIIAAGLGLQRPETLVTVHDVRQMACVQVDLADRNALERDACRLRETIGSDVPVVLLGGIATQKYVEPLAGIFGEQLLFPSAFVGRGNMSRGGAYAALLPRQGRTRLCSGDNYPTTRRAPTKTSSTAPCCK